MKDLLNQYSTRAPEVVFEWNDAETEAKGWVVINSLRGGAAGGGTRMRKGLDRNEVVSLAKTMEIKFTVSGPQIGGAKSGIDFNPSDPRKEGVLRRWYAAVSPLLKHYYGTGGDLNVDAGLEVIPMTEACGVWHPQEGVFNGHFKPDEAQKVRRIGRLRQGVSKVVEDSEFLPDGGGVRYRVADLITGYGVAESVRHFYDLYGGSVRGKRVLVQGWGNVGAAAALYLTQRGAIVTGIIDRVGGILRPEGLGLNDVRELFLLKDGNHLSHSEMKPFDEVNALIWDVGADVFLPCAASRLVKEDQLDRMLHGGLEVISCGANVPFADSEIFYGPISEKADQSCAVIPDFIANCGMARVFGYLMGDGEVQLDDEHIFGDTSRCIQAALERCHARNPNRTGLSSTALSIALEQIV